MDIAQTFVAKLRTAQTEIEPYAHTNEAAKTPLLEDLVLTYMESAAEPGRRTTTGDAR
jgi:hypothetical protein